MARIVRQTVTVSLTERPQFRRLVDFVQEVETHARENDDYVLLSIVDGCHDDLRRMLDERDGHA